MRVHDLELPGLKLIELKVHGDARGFFVERFQADRFKEMGLPTQFIQDNHSRSAPGVLRGIHFQTQPSQGKLVGVTRGRVWDVAVDLRPGSKTYGQHYGVELSDTNGKLLWIPKGFGHGFCVIGEEMADFLYKVDAPYSPKTEGGVHWADPDLGIRWPLADPQVSERDRALPSFAAYREKPAFE